jgi:hypothetical protein
VPESARLNVAGLMLRGRCRILEAKAAYFANGKTRDGALVGFSEEETYPTPQSSAAEGYEQQDASCTDRSSDCAGWVASGECKKNPAFMDGMVIPRVLGFLVRTTQGTFRYIVTLFEVECGLNLS